MLFIIWVAFVLEYIQVIMGLEEEVQHDVMNAIQEVELKIQCIHAIFQSLIYESWLNFP